MSRAWFGLFRDGEPIHTYGIDREQMQELVARFNKSFPGATFTAEELPAHPFGGTP